MRLEPFVAECHPRLAGNKLVPVRRTPPLAGDLSNRLRSWLTVRLDGLSPVWGATGIGSERTEREVEMKWRKRNANKI